MLAVIQALWLIIPAYAANAFPPVLKGETALDMNKKWRGKRVLGSNKTVRGTFGGIAFGILIGLIQVSGQGYIPTEWELNLPVMTDMLVLLLAVGALVGDIIGSFIKRRLNYESGASFPILDQDDFVLFSLLFALLAFQVPLEYFIILLVITPPIHWIANWIGYKVKIKKNPW